MALARPQGFRSLTALLHIIIFTILLIHICFISNSYYEVGEYGSAIKTMQRVSRGGGTSQAPAALSGRFFHRP